MKKNKAEAVLIFITMIWGMGFPLTSTALKGGIGPYTLVSVKSFVATLVLAIIFKNKFKLMNLKMIASGALVALALVIGNIFQTLGMVYTTPSKSGFITGLSVVFVPILLIIIYRKRPKRRIVLGALTAVIGLFFLTYNGDAGVNIGDLLTVLCAFSYSFQILLVDKTGKEYDGIMLAIVELFMVGVFSLIPAVMFESYKIAPHSSVIICIFITGIFGGGVGMAVQNKMQPQINPSHAAIIYLFEPVFGVFFSSLIGDVLSPIAIIGCLLIFLAMFISREG